MHLLCWAHDWDDFHYDFTHLKISKVAALSDITWYWVPEIGHCKREGWFVKLSGSDFITQSPLQLVPVILPLLKHNVMNSSNGGGTRPLITLCTKQPSSRDAKLSVFCEICSLDRHSLHRLLLKKDICNKKHMFNLQANLSFLSTSFKEKKKTALHHF